MYGAICGALDGAAVPVDARARCASSECVFWAPSPLLQERLPRQASGGPGRLTLDASGGGGVDMENWASGINLALYLAAHGMLSWSTLWVVAVL